MSNTSTASALAVGQTYRIEPGTLTIGANVRLDTHPKAKEFAASIKARGVLQSITAWVDEDGSLVVDRGQRRTLTATQVGTPDGTVPVYVIAKPDEADRITDQLSENLHRAAMFERETRDAIEQLALLGVSAAQIVKRTAIGRQTVNAALSVTGSEATRARMDEKGLTLQQAATFAEFEDDSDALAELDRTLSWGRSMEHTAQRLRDQRTERKALCAEVERLRAEGLPVLDPHVAPENLHRLRLDNLVTEDGTDVHEQDWPQIDGAAVVVTTEWEYPEPEDAEGTDAGDGPDADAQMVYVPVWVCTDLAVAGLRYRHDRPVSTRRDEGGEDAEAQAEREAAAAERRTVLANNKAWRSAEVVRREWLAGFITRKRVPKGAEALICEAVLIGDHRLSKAMQCHHNLLCSMLGAEHQPGYYGGAPECARLAEQPSTGKAATMRTLAAVLVAWEETTGVHTWRNPDQWDAKVMGALTEWGYQPSDVETILTGTAPETANNASQPDTHRPDADTDGEHDESTTTTTA